MADTRRLPLVTLGWQSWALIAVVIVIAVAGAVYLMLG
jgi:hypothetical protein